MNQKVDPIKAQVRALRAYTLSPHRAAIKINQNENPYDLPTRIKQETLRRLENRKWSRYPEFIPTSLLERLAKFSAWNPDGVIAGNGSNELIQALLMVTIAEGKRVFISEPTFALYRQVTTILGGVVTSVALTPELGYDARALSDSIRETKPDVVIICSPNNPTGCVLADEDLRSLLEVAQGLVVIDEAYHEFAGHTVVPLLNDFENLVVLRTFSKAMGLAALRVGYLLGAPQVVQEIRKAVLPYNLNAFSQTAAEAALDLYEAELKPLVEKIVSERERVFGELSKIDGLSPVESRANFMIVRSKLEPKQVFAELIKRNVLVRDVSGYPMLGDYFRISVGTPEENDILIAALREIMLS